MGYLPKGLPKKLFNISFGLGVNVAYYWVMTGVADAYAPEYPPLLIGFFFALIAGPVFSEGVSRIFENTSTLELRRAHKKRSLKDKLNFNSDLPKGFLKI